MEKIEQLTGEALYNDQLGPEAGRGNYKNGAYMLTYTGKQFYPLNPDPADIDIKDIAHALSNCCRFTGHVRNFYSVAQHSVIVSELCEPENALAGLLHDASEAYLSDISRPVKYTQQMEGYREIEHKLEEVIFAKFNLDFPMTKDVKWADDTALMSEGYYLFHPVPDWIKRRLADNKLIVPAYQLTTCWPPAIAKAMFMKRFILLSRGINTEATQEEIDAATKEN
jgi:hypothetical protein